MTSLLVVLPALKPLPPFSWRFSGAEREFLLSLHIGTVVVGRKRSRAPSFWPGTSQEQHSITQSIHLVNGLLNKSVQLHSCYSPRPLRVNDNVVNKRCIPQFLLICLQTNRNHRLPRSTETRRRRPCLCHRRVPRFRFYRCQRTDLCPRCGRWRWHIPVLVPPLPIRSAHRPSLAFREAIETQPSKRSSRGPARTLELQHGLQRFRSQSAGPTEWSRRFSRSKQYWWFGLQQMDALRPRFRQPTHCKVFTGFPIDR